MAIERERDSIECQECKKVAGKVNKPEISELGPSFADLPWCVTSKVLLNLPMKSVLICRCVCKSWKTLISDPFFAKMHLKSAPASVMIRANDPRTLYLLDFESEKLSSESELDRSGYNCPIKFKLPPGDEKPKSVMRISNELYAKFNVVNSCNGLLCLFNNVNRELLVVCNPITGEFIRLPKAAMVEKIMDTEKIMDMDPMYTGFGFHPKTNEYKLIKICGRFVQHPGEQPWIFDNDVVLMHTLGTSTWRKVGCDSKFRAGLRFPTCVNGALHWIGIQRKWSILCFNFESEKFQSFPSPPDVFNNNAADNVSMGELRGCLYICESRPLFYRHGGHVRLWVMKDYGIGESWTNVFSNGNHWPDGLYRPLNFFKKGDGDALLMYHSDNRLMYCEPGKNGYKIFKIRGITTQCIEAIPHIPSFISLKDAAKGENVEVLNVHSWVYSNGRR